jgi:hypothetical protein
VYVFQLPNGRLINHITTGSLRMALYTKELHLFVFEKWAIGREQNLQWRPELQSSAGSASFTLRARSPALHLSLGNVLVKAHGRKFFRIKEIGRVEVSVPLAVVGIDAIYLDLEIETAVCQVIG